MNVEHLGIYAVDPAALAAWYGEVLELKELRRITKEGRPPVVFLQGETGAVIEILPTDDAPARRELTSPGFAHLGIAVADFAAEEARLEALGIDLWGIRSTSNGWRIGYFRDPEGNILELVQR